jgi:F0F1-type ATP synthase assembly protein I
VCPQERLVIISKQTGLSFAIERIGPLAALIATVLYLLVLYLFAIPKTSDKLFASVYSESLIKITLQHLLLLVGERTASVIRGGVNRHYKFYFPKLTNFKALRN